VVWNNCLWVAIQATAERIILDPKYHDVLAVVKAARNGAVYGTKVRFPHALVYDTTRPPNTSILLLMDTL
jgi:hypothetical protein